MQNAITKCRRKHSHNKLKLHLKVKKTLFAQRVKHVLYYIYIVRQRSKSEFYSILNNQASLYWG